MRGYVVITDVEELGPYIAAEVVGAGYAIRDVERTFTVLAESDVELLYPDALAAWRRLDDTIAERTAELLEACWEAEEAVD
jgi:hypothetical protein